MLAPPASPVAFAKVHSSSPRLRQQLWAGQAGRFPALRMYNKTRLPGEDQSSTKS